MLIIHMYEERLFLVCPIFPANHMYLVILGSTIMVGKVIYPLSLFITFPLNCLF